MKKLCAWCRAFLGGDPSATKITHGICPSCLEREKSAAIPLTHDARLDSIARDFFGEEPK